MGPVASRPSARAAGSGSSSASGTRPASSRNPPGHGGAEPGDGGGVAGEVDLAVGEGEQRRVDVAHLDVRHLHRAVGPRLHARAGELDVSRRAAGDRPSFAGRHAGEVEVEPDAPFHGRRGIEAEGRVGGEGDAVAFELQAFHREPAVLERRRERVQRARDELSARDVEGLEPRLHEGRLRPREGKRELDGAGRGARHGIRGRAERGQRLERRLVEAQRGPQRRAVEGALAARAQLGDR